MTVGQFLIDTTKKLDQAGIETPRLDCLVLLEDTLGKDRAQLLAHPEMAIPRSNLAVLNNFVVQRLQHMPLAYIRGSAAFFGRYFAVNKYVLVPRPETEAMIEMLKKTGLPAQPRIADIGTGSGCIGITVALELPGVSVFLYDIDARALQVASKNAQAHNVHVRAAKQNLLHDVTEHFDVLLANLPYVPEEYLVNTAAAFEPKIALFAGDDGLELYRTFWAQIAGLEHQPAHIFTEALLGQHTRITQLAKTAGYDQSESLDLVQHFIRGH